MKKFLLLVSLLVSVSLFMGCSNSKFVAKTTFEGQNFQATSVESSLEAKKDLFYQLTIKFPVRSMALIENKQDSTEKVKLYEVVTIKEKEQFDKLEQDIKNYLNKNLPNDLMKK